MATTTVGKAQRAARELKQLLNALHNEREAHQHVAGHELWRLEKMVEDCASHEAFADASTFRQEAEAR